MPLLFYFPLILWAGLFTVARDEVRVAVKTSNTRSPLGR
jgi:hypothetical protein